MVTARNELLPFGKPLFGEEEVQAVTAVLKSGWVGMGPETLRFEEELAEFVGSRFVVTVNSCTSALHLSLLANDVGSGDEVICPSLTWRSTANAALYVGAVPVFCDVDEHTWSVSIETILQKLTPKTRAVMVVHYGGLAMDVSGLRNALPERVRIIEDAAHALGASYDSGAPVGSSGNCTCFSFYANKNLATAEGGAIALDDSAMAARLAAMRLHGLSSDAWKRFTHPNVMLKNDGTSELGYKMNFTDLQAAIGRVQLRRQPEFAATRQEIAELYVRLLSGQEAGIRFQTKILCAGHAKHLFVVRLPKDSGCDRDEVIERLRALNIGATVHYYVLHRMPLYQSTSELPVTEQLDREILTLPISASMSSTDAGEVADKLSCVLRECGCE